MSRIVDWGPGMEPFGGACAALGVFDGVHVGHQALVRDTVALARGKDSSAVVVTFDRDPDQIVTPASASPQLLDLEDKLSLLSDLGPDAVLVVPFTATLAGMPPLVFLDEVLLSSMSPVAVVVGHDFRFGHRAEGDVDTLLRYGSDRGFTVVAHELVRDGGEPVTSTRIRGLVAVGDVAGAARLLGRAHRVRGDVVPGRGEGAELGAPTANLQVGPFAALPADGVYAGRVSIDGTAYAAALSVGTPPTFPDATGVLEAHVVGFRGDLYGRGLTVEFVERIREQRRFDDVMDLKAQIALDIHEARRLAGHETT